MSVQVCTAGEDTVPVLPIEPQPEPATDLTAPRPLTFQGYIDLFGYHTLAGGWFFTGWATDRPDLEDGLRRAVARFDDEQVSEHVASLFFSRVDVEQGVGFILFFRAAVPGRSVFATLRLDMDGEVLDIRPVEQTTRLPENKLIPRLEFMLTLCEEGLAKRDMLLLLDGHDDATGNGYVEYFGYHATAGGWMVSGWIGKAWAEGQAPDRLVLSFEDGDVHGVAENWLTLLFDRPELADGSRGVVMFLPAPPASLGPLGRVGLHAGGIRTTLLPMHGAAQLREAALKPRLTADLRAASPGLLRDRLTNLLTRSAFTGEATMDALAPAIFFYVDNAILCGADGLVLCGWMLARPGAIHAIRLRSGDRVSVLRMEDCIRIDRQDVLASMAVHGFDDPACGFIAYLPEAVAPEMPIYMEIENDRFKTGFRPIDRPAQTGMGAIRHLLGLADLRFGEMRHAFDHVLGPAVTALNETRLATAPGHASVIYGTLPVAPAASVIVPLYGRLDFVEYQMALFSAHPGMRDVEFIYVLDEPARRREARGLFAGIYERFKLPFRAVLLERNLGYAPANNAGLRYANGEFVAFLNSDIFPQSDDWLAALTARLAADPKLGVIGPVLLYEDGSIQHCGMYFERLPEYGDFFFCQHADKGRRAADRLDVQTVPAITGACMVMRRALAEQIGGFDEAYVIGDFEDSDLCLKLQAMGLDCAVDHGAKMYHLERKSQAGGEKLWRLNMTAYNAWTHDRRWGGLIAARQDGGRL
jgi:GT2 family glycosyltransferase